MHNFIEEINRELNMLWPVPLLIPIINTPQSTTPAGIGFWIIINMLSGHPSFKGRGNLSVIYRRANLMGLKG